MRLCEQSAGKFHVWLHRPQGRCLAVLILKALLKSLRDKPYSAATASMDKRCSGCRARVT